MLDVDSENMIEVLRSFPDMIQSATAVADKQSVPDSPSITICGMGGSGYTGDLLRVYMANEKTPIHVVKDYTLPAYVERGHVVIAISYSGNTEETIAVYRAAVRRGCHIVTLSSGGKLEELSSVHKNTHLKIPAGIQPRLSVPYLFIPVLMMLNKSGFVDDQSAIIKKTITELHSLGDTIEKRAKELAGKLIDKVPLIYSSQKLFCLAEKWKTDINENAKMHVFYNMIPEFNHNEICGFQNPNADYHVIIIRDVDDHERVKKRIEVFKKLVKSYHVEITELALTGSNMMTRLLSTIWMGQFLGYYLALGYGRDPTPVDIIEQLKKDLK